MCGEASNAQLTPRTHRIPSFQLIRSSFNLLDLLSVVGFQAVVGYGDRPEKRHALLSKIQQQLCFKFVGISMEFYNPSRVWIECFDSTYLH